MLIHLLTLNPCDFARYPGITALTPGGVMASPPIELADDSSFEAFL